MKRPTSQVSPKKGEFRCPDKGFLKSYPQLAMGLCDGWWEDGKPRVPWTLTIRMDSDSVNICLNDKDANAGAYTTAETLAAAFELIEAALVEGSLSWRRWRK